VFLHLTRFPVTATRIFLTLNVVFARAPQRFHAGRFIYIYGKKKKSVKSRKIFLQFRKKPNPNEHCAVLKKKKERRKTHFLKSSRNICDVGHKTAAGNERVEARSDRISHAPEPPQRAFRRDTNHRE